MVPILRVSGWVIFQGILAALAAPGIVSSAWRVRVWTVQHSEIMAHLPVETRNFFVLRGAGSPGECRAGKVNFRSGYNDGVPW
jgi:hypothetical protein